MICPTCGKEYEGETCPLCASLKTEHTIADALGSGWFTAVCVMATVSLGLSLLSCTIDVIGILATIFLWILYRDGRPFAWRFSVPLTCCRCCRRKPFSVPLIPFAPPVPSFAGRGWSRCTL